MGQIQSFGELLDMARRRFVLIYLVALVGIIATVIYARSLPRTYESIAVIQVEIPTVAGQDGSNTARITAAQRLQLIQQRLMVRDNMIAMVKKHGLFADAPALSENDKAQLLRESTLIDSVAVNQQNGQTGELSALIIRIRLDDPQKAADVANDMADSVIAASTSSQSRRAAETLEFFRVEEERVSAAIAELETKIADFRRANDSALPETLEARREEIARLRENTDALDQRILELKRELTAFDTTPPAETAEPRGRVAIAEELRRLNVELAQARRVFTPRHPEILRIEGRIAAITSGSRSTQVAVEQRQVNLLNSEIGLLETEKAQIAERLEALQASITLTPSVDMTLSIYARELEQLQERFSATTRQRTEAEVGQRLEANQQAERFEMLETAIAPEFPISASRKKTAALGAAASLGLAFVLAFLLDQRRPVIRSSAQMQRQLDLAPLITIPFVVTPADRRRASLALAGQAAMVVGGLAVLGLVVMALRVDPSKPIGLDTLTRMLSGQTAPDA